jgi:hypothetical protein
VVKVVCELELVPELVVLILLGRTGLLELLDHTEQLLEVGHMLLLDRTICSRCRQRRKGRSAGRARQGKGWRELNVRSLRPLQIKQDPKDFLLRGDLSEQ